MSEFFGPEAYAKVQKQIEEGTTSKLTPEEEAIIEKQKQALQKFFSDRVVAKYKIEVIFGPGRSTWKHFPGVVSLYLSGTKLNGGGDEKLYMCPKEDCQGVIFPNERLGAQVHCRKCQMMWNEKELVGEVFYRLTPNDWATVIHGYFVKLDCNADIYLKYHPTDIRYQTAMELARKRGGEAINKARNNRGLHIYPLKNIIKDTNQGADLHKRILAFIKS